MLGYALFPLMHNVQTQIRPLDQAMNDSVGSVPMKLLPSRVIDCPRVKCSVSPFSSSCPDNKYCNSFLSTSFLSLLVSVN